MIVRKFTIRNIPHSITMLFSMQYWVDFIFKLFHSNCSFFCFSVFHVHVCYNADAATKRRAGQEHSSQIPISTAMTQRKCSMLERATTWVRSKQSGRNQEELQVCLPLSATKIMDHMKETRAAPPPAWHRILINLWVSRSCILRNSSTEMQDSLMA